jgi:hypothetical protein
MWVKDFCENECILQSKFYYWKNKSIKNNRHKEQPSNFVPIVFTGSTSQMQTKRKAQQKLLPENADQVAGDVFEIVYPNGVKLRVPVGADINQLRSLILLTQ